MGSKKAEEVFKSRKSDIEYFKNILRQTNESLSPTSIVSVEAVLTANDVEPFLALSKKHGKFKIEGINGKTERKVLTQIVKIDKKVNS